MNIYTCPLLKPMKVKNIQLDKASTFRLSRLGINLGEQCTVMIRHKHHVVVIVKGVRYGLDRHSAESIEVSHD